MPLQGEDSDTAIHLAALYGHADCVRLLLEAGARADVADADGAVPLHDAAVRASVMQLGKLPCPLGYRRSLAMRALFALWQPGPARRLRCLVLRAAPTPQAGGNAKDPSTQAPQSGPRSCNLACLPQAGGYADICAMLLDAAPSAIDRGDSEGDTPLHNAARGGHEAVVQVRAAAGRGSAMRCGKARRRLAAISCLGMGARETRLPSHPLLPPTPPQPQLLLERGADATLQNDEFKTAAQLAERGTPGRQLLEDAQRQAEAAAAAAQPQVAPPAAEVA